MALNYLLSLEVLTTVGQEVAYLPLTLTLSCLLYNRYF